MDIRQAIGSGLAQADMVVNAYLADLNDEDLLVRALPNTNHIAWQLGHLISSERLLIDKVVPRQVADLPAGFAEKHTKDTASLAEKGQFLTKDEYLELAARVRAGTLKTVSDMALSDFDRPVEKMPPSVKVVGDMYFFVAMHWLMHAGQWALIRRKLGRPPLF